MAQRLTIPAAPRVNRNHSLTRMRRLSQQFKSPGSGATTSTVEVQSPNSFEVVSYPAPAADTDQEALCVRLNTSTNCQVEGGIRNQIGYLEINDNTNQRFWRASDIGTIVYQNDAGTDPISTIEQDGSGDAGLAWTLTGGVSFTAGIDNSDGDKWKLSAGLVLGTNDKLVINGNTVIIPIDAQVVGSLQVDGSLQTGGSFATPIRTVTANNTVTNTDHTVLADSTAGNIAVTLLSAASLTNRIMVVKKIDVTVNTVTITANGAEFIDGNTTVVLAAQWESRILQSNGAAWYILGKV